jgi:hypothetical protein
MLGLHLKVVLCQVFEQLLRHVLAGACVFESSGVRWRDGGHGRRLEERLLYAGLSRHMRSPRLEHAAPPLCALFEVGS